MTPGSPPIRPHVQRYDAAGARAIRNVVQSIYERSYADAIASGNPFDSISAFMDRFDKYSSNPDLDMAVAYDAGSHALGQIWGWPLNEHTSWWAGLLSEPEPDFTREDGHRTFALSEIMVVQERRCQGIGRHLHDKLLSARPEPRATLLVERDNDRAKRAYKAWGWYPVSQLRPAWPDAPTYDVLMLDLQRFRAEE